MKNIFGENLKNLRKEFGLSQSDLAAKLAEEGLEISYKAISKWEQGTGYPEIPTLVLLAEIFETSIDYLLTGKDIRAEHEREVKKERGLVEFADAHIKAILEEGILDIHIKDFEQYGRGCLNFYAPGLVKPRVTNEIPFVRSDIKIPIPTNAILFDLQLWYKTTPNINIRTQTYSISE